VIKKLNTVHTPALGTGHLGSWALGLLTRVLGHRALGLLGTWALIVLGTWLLGSMALEPSWGLGLLGSWALGTGH
jgi:hypothetical protein